jgi:hypothetical protein
MKECFVSCIVDGAFYCRCSVGDLTEGEEVDYFKRESGIIEGACSFTFHEGLSLDTVAERIEHQKLMDKFKSENSIEIDPRPMIPAGNGLYVLQNPHNPLPYDPPPHVKKMREFIAIAEDIRAGRPEVPPIEEAVEWYALLFPIHASTDVPEYAFAARFLGKLTEMQIDAIDIAYQKSYTGKHPIRFYCRQSFPAGSEVEKRLDYLLSKSNLSPGMAEALDTVVAIAERVSGMDESELKAYVESVQTTKPVAAPAEVQCYVYVIDIKRQFIAFALSCPDEKTGTRACMMAVNETGFDGNDRFSFQSGVTGVGSFVTIQIESDSWLGAIAAQDKQVTGRGGRIIVREGKKTHKQFDRDAFEFAASHTNEFLTGGTCAESHKEILAFMRSVDKALKKLTGVVAHSIETIPTVESAASSEPMATVPADTTESESANDTQTATQPAMVESIEWYALASHGSRKNLYDSDDVAGKIQNAEAAVSIGRLTANQMRAFLLEYEKGYYGWDCIAGGYNIVFISRRSIQDGSVEDYRLKALLGKKLQGYRGKRNYRQEALDAAVRMAKDIRKSEKPVAVPPVQSAPMPKPVKTLPILLARKKDKTEKESESTDDNGRTTYDGNFLANMSPPTAENMIVDNVKELAKEISAPIVAAIKEGTAVNKKGFQSLKSIDHQSLSELVKTLPPLHCEKEDENWVTASTAVKNTGEPLGNLNKQRQRGESFPFEGLVYGRDPEGRIWCHVSGSRKVFYRKSDLSGQIASR